MTSRESGDLSARVFLKHKSKMAAISFPEPRSPWPVRKRELWEHPFWNNKGNNRILHIRFHCSVRSLHLWYLWRMPEMNAPRALVFRPLVKGNEALGTRLKWRPKWLLLCARSRVHSSVSAACDCCVFKFLRCSVNGKNLARCQGEISVFKLLMRSVGKDPLFSLIRMQFGSFEVQHLTPPLHYSKSALVETRSYKKV